MELLISAIVAILICEFYIWLPRISQELINLAVKRVDPTYRDRCHEEWLADIDSIPNSALKLIQSVSILWGVHRINLEVYGEWLEVRVYATQLDKRNNRAYKQVGELRRKNRVVSTSIKKSLSAFESYSGGCKVETAARIREKVDLIRCLYEDVFVLSDSAARQLSEESVDIRKSLDVILDGVPTKSEIFLKFLLGRSVELNTELLSSAMEALAGPSRILNTHEELRASHRSTIERISRLLTELQEDVE